MVTWANLLMKQLTAGFFLSKKIKEGFPAERNLHPDRETKTLPDEHGNTEKQRFSWNCFLFLQLSSTMMRMFGSRTQSLDLIRCISHLIQWRPASHPAMPFYPSLMWRCIQVCCHDESRYKSPVSPASTHKWAKVRPFLITGFNMPVMHLCS